MFLSVDHHPSVFGVPSPAVGGSLGLGTLQTADQSTRNEGDGTVSTPCFASYMYTKQGEKHEVPAHTYHLDSLRYVSTTSLLPVSFVALISMVVSVLMLSFLSNCTFDVCSNSVF